MISIIVSFKNQHLIQSFQENVQKTIGVTYEIISIDNNPPVMGLCEAYNEGLEKVNFDNICFCHEDVIFDSAKWGVELVKLLQNEYIGLVGVAGALYKSRVPTSWVAIPTDYYRVNMTQQMADGTKEIYELTKATSFSEVAVLDGCFIAGRRDVFAQYPWNDAVLKGFHLYDIDICRRVGKQYKLVVSNQISLIHLSAGVTNNEWLKMSEDYHLKYAKSFPLQIEPLSKGEKKELEYYAHYRYVLLLIKFKRQFFSILVTISKGFTMAPRKRENFSLIKQLLKTF